MAHRDVTVLMAVRTGEDCARLALHTLWHVTSPPPPVIIADNGTSAEFRAWVRRDHATRVVSLADRIHDSDDDPETVAQHSRSLDDLVEQVATDWFLALDSDVEIRHPGWLRGLREHAEASAARAVGELEPGWGPVRPRLAPHALLVHTATFRSLGTSFRGCAAIEDAQEAARFRAMPRGLAYRLSAEEAAGYRTATFWSTGAKLFERLVAADIPWSDTPPGLRARYRHLGHMSWAAEHADLRDAHRARQRYVCRRLAEITQDRSSGTSA